MQLGNKFKINIIQSKISLILIMNYTLLVLLISRFNERFLFLEYSYEPLFLLNIFILFSGIFLNVIKSNRIEINTYELLIYLLTLWMLISILFNMNEHSINGTNIGGILNIIISMFYVTMIYLWRENFSNQLIIKILCYMVIVAALIGLIALISILFPEVMISLFNWDTNDIVRGTISPINNGTFLGLFIIPSISLFIYYQKSPKRHLYLFCFILILIGLISTGRRGSYFPSLLMIFVFFGIQVIRNFTVQELKRYSKYFLIIFILLFVFTLYLINKGEVGRLFGMVDTHRDNIGRIVRMEPAFEMIKLKPITGDGVGNYYLRLREEHFSSVETITYRSWIQLSDPHNTYVMVLAETGIVGFIIFMSIIIYIIKKLRPYDVIGLGILLGVIIFLTNCFVDTRLWKGLVRLDAVFWIFVGLGIIYNLKFKEKMKHREKS